MISFNLIWTQLRGVYTLLGTHFGKSAQRAQKAHGHEAQHEHLPPVGQKVWVLIHDGSDDGF